MSKENNVACQVHVQEQFVLSDGTELCFPWGPGVVAIGGHVSGGASPLGTRKHKSGEQH